MCGWCFAFGNVMEQFQQKHANRFDFSVFTGGMVVGENQKPLSHMREYIKGAIPRLEKMTGTKFGEKYLNEILEPGTYISSSEKPSFAFVTFKNLQPEKSIAFAHALQKVFFVEGKSLNEDETYKVLAKQFNISENDFLNMLNSNEARITAFEEFQQVRNWGISGFPAVLLFNNGKGYMVSNGYTDLATLEKQVEKLLK
jgi:putative protein-disulfide isomerase